MDDKKRVSVGYEDFKTVIDKDFYYVDKTMLIYDIINRTGKVNLITRPRRFGKTLNMSMLRYFFDIAEKDSAYIFDSLKISGHYDRAGRYMNAYPVISLSLKGGKMNEFSEAIINICLEIQLQYKKYSFILDSHKLSDGDKESYRRILQADSVKDKGEYNQSLAQLSRYLEQYYGKKTVILIDEYDVPLENAYFRGFYDEMAGFIRSLFESALKTNDALEFAVITGCLRISKESIFTGLNNLKTNSILNTRYAEYFGFVESEVRELFEYYGIEDKFGTAKNWYDGYLFGDKEVYNPWSVMNYVDSLQDDRNAFPEAAWANSSSNNIIRRLVENADADIKSKLEALMNGGCVETFLNGTVTYGDLDEQQENIWNFLFFTGYLKVKSIRVIDEQPFYSLVIPNKEISLCYKNIIMQYFDRFKRGMDSDALYKALLTRDADGFAAMITALLQKSISFYDNAENFYHGLISGLLAYNPYYRMESNRETGDGRCDIALYQADDNQNAILIELKICREGETAKAKCRETIEQINRLHYSAEAEERGYTNIIKYGVAFSKKLCSAIVE